MWLLNRDSLLFYSPLEKYQDRERRTDLHASGYE
jgi:hypothetical protein